MRWMKICSLAPMALALVLLGCQPYDGGGTPKDKPKSDESIKKDDQPGLKIDVDVPTKKGDTHIEIEVKKTPDKEDPAKNDEASKSGEPVKKDDPPKRDDPATR